MENKKQKSVACFDENCESPTVKQLKKELREAEIVDRARKG